jgi:hypothetical protein
MYEDNGVPFSCKFIVELGFVHLSITRFQKTHDSRIVEDDLTVWSDNHPGLKTQKANSTLSLSFWDKHLSGFKKKGDGSEAPAHNIKLICNNIITCKHRRRTWNTQTS